MDKTSMQMAIQKIDEQIEIAQTCIVNASKVKDSTSMNRHHGKKIAFVFFRQELVNLLEMEKQQMFDYVKTNYVFGEKSLKFHLEEFENYYNETYKSE